MLCCEFGLKPANYFVIYKTLRKLLFLLPPETAHAAAISFLNILVYCRLTIFFKNTYQKSTIINNIHFANPLGIAAGFDKYAKAISGIEGLGVGFIELGTFTPKPQTGNAKPRLFRLAKSHALINRMGLNNLGIDAAIKKIQNKTFSIPVGISITKNNDTSYEQAIDDYLYCLEKAYNHCSYIAVNISCPNVANPADFWTGKSFADSLTKIKAKQLILQQQTQHYVPIYIKLSPDLTEANIRDCADLINTSGLDGVIATNTTSTRPNYLTEKFCNEKGGLSGEPLFPLSLRCVKALRRYLKPELTIIAVGGIDSAATAKAYLDAGANLLQLYTGLIYEGPGLIKKIMRKL